MTKFANSYHFIDSAKPLDQDGWRKDVANVDPTTFGLTPATQIDGHAIYADGGKSGRLTCTIKLECPTVVGGQQFKLRNNEDEYTVILPYLFQGEPAIPAASIKGLISSVIEAASLSRYRVLHDSKLTVAWYPGGNRNNPWTRAEKGKHGHRIGSTHDYFTSTQKPMTVQDGSVSPADAILGFVREKANRRGLEALAGKLVLSHGLLHQDHAPIDLADLFDTSGADLDVTDEVVTDVFGNARLKFVRLKEQGAPMKRPSDRPEHKDLRSATPNFYFKKQLQQAEDQFIFKEDFGSSPPSDYKPMGRKSYLHHVGPDAQPYRTRTSVNDAGRKRRAAALPLKSGLSFVFHIDYANLSDAELALLCFALCPSERFRHKIGRGRGLGLGSVKITPVRHDTVNRKERYERGDPFAGCKRMRPGNRTSVPHAPPADAGVMDESKKHREWLTTKDPSALAALMTIGERHNFDGTRPNLEPVLFVPLSLQRLHLHNQPDSDVEKWAAEDRSFTWFTLNDTGQNQKLASIKAGKPFPLLSAHAERERTERVSNFRGHVVVLKTNTKGETNPTTVFRKESLNKAGLDPSKIRDGEQLQFIEATKVETPSDDYSIRKAKTQGILIGQRLSATATQQSGRQQHSQPAASVASRPQRGTLERSGAIWLLLPDENEDEVYELTAAQLSAAGLTHPKDGQTVAFTLGKTEKGQTPVKTLVAI